MPIGFRSRYVVAVLVMTRFVLILVACLPAMAGPRLAVAQAPVRLLPPVDHPSPSAQRVTASNMSGPGWHEYQSITHRLEAIELENARLREESSQLRKMIASPQSSVAPASFTPNPVEDVGFARQAGWDTASGACPDCGKQTCEGLPHLCGICLEKLSWNKASGWRIVPFGRLRGEAIYSSAPTTGDAVIVFLNPRNPGISEDTATVHAKQSQLNFRFTGPNLGNWQTGGLLIGNFMSSTPLRNISGYNIVNAYGEIKNENWRFAFGRMLDLFGPISPTNVNQLAQRGAGNIGIYRGAMHVDRYLAMSEVARWTLSARIAQQDISDYAGIPGIRGKDNGWPNIEGRLGLELGPECDYGRPLEVGLSGVLGETQAVADPVLNQGIFFPAIGDVAQTRGAALDFQLRGPKVGFRGEVWWGEAAGTYFVAVLQSLNPETAQAVESVGGWAEIYYKMNSRITMHVGYGIDDPRNGDLGFLNPGVGVGQISYNDVAWWNAIWNVTDYFELALEVSHRRTRFLDPVAANEGTLIHFASTFSF